MRANTTPTTTIIKSKFFGLVHIFQVINTAKEQINNESCNSQPSVGWCQLKRVNEMNSPTITRCKDVCHHRSREKEYEIPYTSRREGSGSTFTKSAQFLSSPRKVVSSSSELGWFGHISKLQPSRFCLVFMDKDKPLVILLKLVK